MNLEEIHSMIKILRRELDTLETAAKKLQPNPTVDDEGTYWRDNQGRLHRRDGPAIEYSDGDVAWYLHGQPWYDHPSTSNKDGEWRRW
jgi:hypothetical protein